MNVIFCGGGTVGHISPAIAIAEEFKKRNPDCNIAFIGRYGGSENEIIKKNGYKLYEIHVSGLIRRLTLKNLKVIKNVFTAEKEAKKILRSFKPHAVIGTGGYVCLPVVRTAKRLGIFTAIHESNASFGLTSKLLAKKCDVVFLGAKTDKEAKNMIYTGNPVREEFYKTSKNEAKKLLNIPLDTFFILSVGGSLGAERLNGACLEMMESFSSKDTKIAHYHSCGARYYELVKQTHASFLSKNDRCKIFPYIDKMPLFLSAADIVISRCGAMTLAETAATATPSILIPSPNVTGDHQTKNALYFAKNGASVIINDSELSESSLTKAVKSLMKDTTILDRMSKSARGLSSVAASKKIVKTIEKHISEAL